MPHERGGPSREGQPMTFRVRLADWHTDQAELKSVRYEVFCVEQSVPESLEWDDIDPQCGHVLAEDDAGRAIGCGRLLPDGHIGRVAVRLEWRGQRVGSALLERLIALAHERGDTKVMLNAQTHAMPFYARYGFAPVGEPFDEAGIPHQAMEATLPVRSA
jgi:predicted GNAT family N-acyltransferase